MVWLVLVQEPLSKLTVLGTVWQNISLLVKKTLSEKKFQKVYANPSSDTLGAGERRDRHMCLEAMSPAKIGFFQYREDIVIKGEHVFPRVILWSVFLSDLAMSFPK